jgi:hypothetical protein
MYKPLDIADWKILSDLASQIAYILIDEMKDGKDGMPKPSIEEITLYSKMNDQLEFMEDKYGPHPLILDTKADIVNDTKEKIQLKERAKLLCLEDDYDLRGVLCKELAELYFEYTGEIEKAKELIKEAKFNLEKSENKNELDEANQIETEIRTHHLTNGLN